jgi:transposase
MVEPEYLPESELVSARVGDASDRICGHRSYFGGEMKESESKIKSPSERSHVHVGIDVSKDKLDVCAIPGPQHQQFSNDDDGHQRLVQWLLTLIPTRVIFEPTGGYERAMVASLVAANLPAIAVNPKQARDFIKGIGRRAKTDRMDAEGLALFGERAQPEVRALPDNDQQEIVALVSRRRQLVSMRTGEKNRLKLARGKVRENIERAIVALDQLIAEIDHDLDSHIGGSPTWQGQEARLLAAKGVGPVVARTLLAHLPELGKISSKRVASLTGLAPFARESGQMRGRRTIGGGRGEVRAMLVLAARSAIVHDPQLRAFHHRLIAAGKEPMQAIVACARKLLVWLNAMMRHGTDWNPPQMEVNLA